jgi:uncharacterized protein YbaR (Trm112 family)
MTTDTSVASELGIYACPACKRLLRQEESVLRCPTCSQDYPIREGVPDFILEELSRSADPELRRMRFIDRMARIYETRLWYPIVLNLYGGFHTSSLAQLVSTVSQKVQSTKGRVLDVACGPSTFGRRIASPSKEVFGIDVSMGMLRQGAAYIEKERHCQRAFRPCKSGGTSIRRWRFRRHPLLWLASSLCGYFDCSARDGSRHEASSNSCSLHFRRRSRWCPKVSPCAGVESQGSRPSCIRTF